MDISTALGLLAGIATVVTLVTMDGNFAMFMDKHAAIVICGGSLAATLIRFPFSTMAHGLPMGVRFAFTMRTMHPRELIEKITEIADLVRKSGPIALESYQVDDAFLSQGLRYIADGYDRDFIRDALEKERDSFLQRLDEGQKIYRAIGDCAPAWGMIGTLLGMVQMFSNMEDPSKLGPFMAVALLATLYGALLANLVCLPIADKLHVKLEEEEISRTIIIDGLLQVRDSKSSSMIKEMLISYLPDHHKAELAEASA